MIRRRAIAVGVGAASVADIDRLNIYHATHLAMRRAIARLGGHDHVLVDGNRIADFERQVGPYTSIVDGDARVYSIACASVVAKVVRDRMMAKLARPLPRVRLGPQPGLRDEGAPRRDPGARAHAAPPRVVAGDPGPARRRPARRCSTRRTSAATGMPDDAVGVMAGRAGRLTDEDLAGRRGARRDRLSRASPSAEPHDAGAYSDRHPTSAEDVADERAEAHPARLPRLRARRSSPSPCSA